MKCSKCGKKGQSTSRGKVVLATPEAGKNLMGECDDCGLLFCGECFVLSGDPCIPSCPKCGGQIRPA